MKKNTCYCPLPGAFNYEDQRKLLDKDCLDHCDSTVGFVDYYRLNQQGKTVEAVRHQGGLSDKK